MNAENCPARCWPIQCKITGHSSIAVYRNLQFEAYTSARLSKYLIASCWCYSFNQSNRVAAVPSWITLASRSLTIGSTIYIVNMTNFLICFQYAKALPFERWTICYCVFFFLPLSKSQHLSELDIPHDLGDHYHCEGLIMIWQQVTHYASGSLDPPMKRKLLFWPLRLETGMV